jgi:hypothetical protein
MWEGALTIEYDPGIPSGLELLLRAEFADYPEIAGLDDDEFDDEFDDEEYDEEYDETVYVTDDSPYGANELLEEDDEVSYELDPDVEDTKAAYEPAAAAAPSGWGEPAASAPAAEPYVEAAVAADEVAPVATGLLLSWDSAAAAAEPEPVSAAAPGNDGSIDDLISAAAFAASDVAAAPEAAEAGAGTSLGSAGEFADTAALIQPAAEPAATDWSVEDEAAPDVPVEQESVDVPEAAPEEPTQLQSIGEDFFFGPAASRRRR